MNRHLLRTLCVDIHYGLLTPLPWLTATSRIHRMRRFYDTDEMDRMVNKLDSDYDRLVKAESTLDHGVNAPPPVALEQWNELLAKFKDLDRRTVGGARCAWSVPDTFSFGRYSLQFAFPLMDPMGKERGLVTVSDFKGEPLASIWARPRISDNTFFFWCVNVDSEETQPFDTPKLGAFILEQLALIEKKKTLAT